MGLCTSDGTTATGATWTAATGFTFTGLVYAVTMPSTTVGFAGGSSGALFKGTIDATGGSTWAQYTWTTSTDPTTGDFEGIAATSVLLACAVGKASVADGGGTLIYVTEDGGTNWGAPTTTIPVSTGLFAVAFQPAGAYFKGFAVGRAGVVLTTVDAISATMTWLPDTVAPITSSSDLLALSFPNQYEAYAVGKSGAIMHYDVTAHPTNSPSNAPTFAPTNATNATTNSDDDLSDGEIAGIVVGSVAAVAVIAAVIYYLNKKQPEPAAPVVVPPEMTMGSPKADTPPASPSSSSVHNAILNAASRRGAVPNSPPESADPDAVNVDFTIQR